MENFEKKNGIYVPIHCHTEHSLLDGLSRPAELAHRAKEIGAPACAITDHGAMSGCLQFYKACQKEGIIPILGMEAYMTPYGHSLSERVPYDQKELRNTPGKGHQRNNYHAILLCKDYTGYKNLCALHTASYAAGYYYKPRIDFELLKEHHEGLIFSNACFTSGQKVIVKSSNATDGFKEMNIEDIQAGQFVLTHEGRWRSVIEPTSRTYDGEGYRFVVEHQFSKSPIECTANHKFFVYDSTCGTLMWKAAKDIVATDYLTEPFRTKRLYKQSNNPDCLFLDKEKLNKAHDSIFRRNLAPFEADIKITPEVMMLFGLWLADGSITITETSKQISFTFNIDEYEGFKQHIIDPAFSQLGVREGYAIQKRNEHNRVDICVAQHRFVSIFYYLFGNTHAEDKFIPSRLLHLNKQSDAALLYGYLLGDGHFHYVEKSNGGQVSSTSVSEALSKGIFDLWKWFSFLPSCDIAQEHDTNGVFHRTAWSVKVNNTFLSQILDKHYIYDTDTFLNILLAAQLWGEKKRQRIVPGNEHQSYFLKKIKTKDRVHLNQRVYCLNVEEDHSFICGGVAVHNCVLGEVNHHLLHGDYDMARDHALRLQDLFGEDYYFEIMNHGLEMEIAIMPHIRELAKELGIKVIATNDSHFTYKEDHKLQRTMMLLGMHKSWADADVAGSFFEDMDVTGQKNISGEDGDSDPIFSMPASLYVKTYDEMMEALCLSESDIPFAEEELANTLEIAKKCNCELPIIDPNDMSQYHTPLYAINKDLQFEDYEKSHFELRDNTVSAVLDAMHAAGKEGDTLQEVLTEHEYDSLLFLMWMCEKGIEERIKPKIEARGEPLPIEFYMKNPPRGFAVNHKHNSPDESFIKGNLSDGKTPEDIIQMYRDRLDYEVSIVCRKGFLDYFSIVQQYCNHARFHDNPPGPGRGCLTDDNLVWMEGGVAKPISDVKIGDVVFDEKGIPSRVLNTYEYDVDEELRKITVYNSDDLVLTSDHKVKVSPCIMHTRQYNKDKTYDDSASQIEPVWIPASEIKPGDWVYSFSVEKDGFICTRVKKNEPYRHVGKVYDLMIDTKNEPSYVTTSCIVHNSGAGALLNYLLGITSVDPLPNKLIFERFLNPDRVGYPDIDVDFNKAYRDEILKPYLREEYGEDNAAGVSTFTYAWGKAAIKAAARVLFNPPESVQWADDLCKLIDDHPKLDLNSELQDEGGNEALKQLIRTGRHYQQIIDLALMLQGRIIGTSIHASAFILSPFKITDKMPLTVPKAERERVQATGESVIDFLISYDGVETQESLGFVKLDLLCIKDLEVLSLTMQIIERVYGCKIDIESIPMDDAAVFQMLEDHLVSGLFQLDGSSGMAQVMDDVTPQSIEEINAVVALFRPGPMDYIPTYVSGKWHPETVSYLDPRLEPILKDTYGVCIAEGTSISTIDGNKNIEEISVGDLVLTKEGNYSKCIDVIDNGYRECVNIRFDRGEGLTCTPDHRLFTQRGWVEAKNLTTSDIVKFFNEFESKEIEEFDPRQWLLGLYLADGHSTGSSIDIACESEEFAIQVKEIAKQAFPSMEHVHIKKRNHVCASGKEATTWYVVFAQKKGNNGFFSDDYVPNEFVDFLREHDLLGKTKENKFWTSDYSFSTVLGFVEGDGCYANRTISQKNRHLLYGVYQALNEYGIPANFYRRDDDLCWNVSFAYKDVLRPRIWLSRYEDPTNRPSMFDESRCYGGFIPTAQLNRTEYLSAMSRADARKIDNQDKVTLTFAKKYDYPKFTEHTEWARVKTVKTAGEKHVYDLTIEKEHSFVANKYTVHNCAYQEQAMQITQVIGGFTGGQADNYRKQAAKKHMDQLVLIKDDFIKGALENDTAPEVADELWEQLVKFGSYAFNRSHSAAYAYIAYRGGFLKAHFPECFLAAMCTIKPMMKKTLKVPAYLEEARQMGVQVKPPHVNYSMEDFDVPEKGVIAFGLGGIKRVGKGAAPIIAEREKNGPFKDFTDFCTRVPKEVGKAPIEALIKAGALDGLGWSRMAMEESIDQIVAFRKDYFREKSKRDLFEDDLFGFGGEDASDESSTPDITLVPPFDTEYSELALMRKEREEFGLYFDKDPRDFCQVSRFMLERELREHSDESRKSGNYDTPMFVNVKEIPDLPDKTHVGFIANVEDFKEFNTKKGKRMASMFVWDNGTGEESRFGFAPVKAKIKCTIFSSVLATIAKPMPDDVVYVTGRISVDQEGKWPTAVLVDTIELVTPDSQWLGSGASIEKMQEFAQAQADMRAYNEEVSNPASKRYMIPAISFKTTDDMRDFCGDLRINKLYLKEGNVQVSAEDDPNGDNTKILHLKQTMGTVKLAAEYGGIAKKIRHPKAARALARKAMLEGKTVDEIEMETVRANS